MDSLDGMPEFDKPENIPLIVPDAEPVEFDPNEALPCIRPMTNLCTGINIDGSMCGRKINHDRAYCIAHEPTPETVIGLFYSRLQSFVQNCQACGPASAGEVITLSHAAKAFSVLWDRKVTMDEAKKMVESVGWRMKGVG